MKDFKDLEDLLCQEIRMVYNSENLLITILPGIIKNVQDIELKTQLLEQMEQSEIQLLRLDKLAKYLETEAGGTVNQEFKELVSAGELIIQKDTSLASQANDLITAAWKIATHEISSYTTATLLAQELGYHYVSELLEQSLEEKKLRESMLYNKAMSTNTHAAIAA